MSAGETTVAEARRRWQRRAKRTVERRFWREEARQDLRRKEHDRVDAAEGLGGHDGDAEAKEQRRRAEQHARRSAPRDAQNPRVRRGAHLLCVCIQQGSLQLLLLTPGGPGGDSF